MGERITTMWSILGRLVSSTNPPSPVRKRPSSLLGTGFPTRRSPLTTSPSGLGRTSGPEVVHHPVGQLGVGLAGVVNVGVEAPGLLGGPPSELPLRVRDAVVGPLRGFRPDQHVL